MHTKVSKSIYFSHPSWDISLLVWEISHSFFICTRSNVGLCSKAGQYHSRKGRRVLFLLPPCCCCHPRRHRRCCCRCAPTPPLRSQNKDDNGRLGRRAGLLFLLHCGCGRSHLPATRTRPQMPWSCCCKRVCPQKITMPAPGPLPPTTVIVLQTQCAR